jgi:hypothetical protein
MAGSLVFLSFGTGLGVGIMGLIVTATACAVVFLAVRRSEAGATAVVEPSPKVGGAAPVQQGGGVDRERRRAGRRVVAGRRRLDGS